MAASRMVRVAAAAGLAIVAAVGVRTMMQPEESAPRQERRMQVANLDLPRGTLLQPGDFTWVPVSDGQVREGVVLEGDPMANRMVGAVVRAPIQKGEAIDLHRIVMPDAPGFLSAALKPGMRAVSVPVTRVSSHAGLLLPGDQVDLILTQQVQSGDAASPQYAGETVLADLRVLAVDRQLDDGRNPDPGKAGGEAHTVTLEVTSEQAQAVAVASRLGDLSLALRSLASKTGDQRAVTDGTTAVASPPIEQSESTPLWSVDVSSALRQSQAPRRHTEYVPVSHEPSLPQVFRGSATSAQ